MYLFRHLQEHFYVVSNFCYVYSDSHSAISFLLTLWEIIILFSPTAIGLRLWLTASFLSLFSNKTFAMTVAMQITHRDLAALFHLYSAYLFWRHLFLTSKSTCLQTTGRTPNACSTIFLPTTTISTKATSQIKFASGRIG